MSEIRLRGCQCTCWSIMSYLLDLILVQNSSSFFLTNINIKKSKYVHLRYVRVESTTRNVESICCRQRTDRNELRLNCSRVFQIKNLECLFIQGRTNCANAYDSWYVFSLSPLQTICFESVSFFKLPKFT